MNKVYKISPEGVLEGLWDDSLADLGEAKIKRASEVEYCEELKGWTVKILVGPSQGKFLPGVFKKRKDALEAEVTFLNQELEEGCLSFDS